MALINKAVLAQAVEKALSKGGFDDVPVTWKAEAERFYTTKENPGRITLNVSSLKLEGTDHILREFNVDTQLIDVTVKGIRDFTLSIRIEADDSLLAQEMAHAIGLHMFSDAVDIILDEACVVIQDMLAATSFEYVWDNREVSAVNLDMLAAVEFSYLETEPVSGGQWIGKVSGESFGEPYLWDPDE
jgi:hypothetical protein